jgi:hypothetical protein
MVSHSNHLLQEDL